MSALPDPHPLPPEVRDAGLAAGMGVVAAGLGLWWLADKVRDSVNEPPSNDEQAPPQV